MHDIGELEARGIPGVYVASAAFVEAGAAQAAALGIMPSAVFVSHPIQDRTDAEVRALAAGALEEVVAALTQGA